MNARQNLRQRYRLVSCDFHINHVVGRRGGGQGVIRHGTDRGHGLRGNRPGRRSRQLRPDLSRRVGKRAGNRNKERRQAQTFQGVFYVVRQTFLSATGDVVGQTFLSTTAAAFIPADENVRPSRYNVRPTRYVVAAAPRVVRNAI